MLTIKIPIIDCSNYDFINKKSKQYSSAFRYLLKSYELSQDKTNINKVKNKFNLNDIEYRSLKSQLDSFIKKQQTFHNKTLIRIKDKENELQELLDKKEKYKLKPFPKDKDKKLIVSIYKLRKSIHYLKININNNPVFGGRKNLQHLTHLHNQYNTKITELDNIYEESELLEQEKKLTILHNSILTQKTKYQNQRLWSISLLGEGNQKGNRFFDFSKLHEGKVVYKPNKNNKILLDVKISKNRLETIKQLVSLTENKVIPITVSLSKDYICLSYDDAKVNGWVIDEKGREKEVNEVKNKSIDKETKNLLIKEVYKKYHQKLRDEMLVGKIEDRVLAIDMNPCYIGLSVIERDKANEDVDKKQHSIKIIDTLSYDLSRFIKKLPKEATKEEREYNSNKHKHEIKEIFHQIFNILNHYKCSRFVMEDLDFKESKEYSKMNTEANRQTKNLWHRGLIEGMITKLCRDGGIELIKIQPSYSSVIGNLSYDYFDPIASSIEIGRRGLYKYIKNLTCYPLISRGILDTVEAIVLANSKDDKAKDVLKVSNAKETWNNVYNLVKKYRWRGSLIKDRLGNKRSLRRCSMSTKKSGIKIFV